MYAISALLFLVARKVSRVPKVTYHFSSIVEYETSETLQDVQLAVARATQLCRPNVRTIG